MGLDAEVLFYIMAFVGVYLTYKILKRYIIMTFWTSLHLLFSLRFKFKYIGLENVPLAGGVLLLGNHVSWIDWLILQIPIQRRINFMMDKNIYNSKYLTSTLKRGEVIPISPKSFKDGFREASSRLHDAKVLAIYPEGKISSDGELSKFQRGYELLDTSYNGTIVPYFINGMFGSVFARYKKNQKKSFFSRRKVVITFASHISKSTKADELQKIIQQLKDDL